MPDHHIWRFHAISQRASPDAYPEWIIGDERAVFGNHGIAIATAEDTNIEVIIRTGEDVSDENLYPCISSMINIGQEGLLVGNIPSGNINKIPWKSGDISVKVFTSDIVPGNVTKIIFLLC